MDLMGFENLAPTQTTIPSHPDFAIGTMLLEGSFLLTSDNPKFEADMQLLDHESLFHLHRPFSVLPGSVLEFMHVIRSNTQYDSYIIQAGH